MKTIISLSAGPAKETVASLTKKIDSAKKQLFKYKSLIAGYKEQLAKAKVREAKAKGKPVAAKKPATRATQKNTTRKGQDKFLRMQRTRAGISPSGFARTK